MENVELFLKACVQYGMDKIDTFQVKELYEARAMYLVRLPLICFIISLQYVSSFVCLCVTRISSYEVRL